MLKGKFGAAAVMLLCGVAVGCQKASPTRPTVDDTASVSAASVTDARTGVTIVAGRPASPAANASISWASQPITLSITNGVTSNGSPLTYTFQVATDSAFTSIAFTKASVAAGNGTTSVTVDKLAGSKTYYWRAQANPASGTGPYSTTRAFVVGPEVTLGTPNLSSPVNGARAFSPVKLTINSFMCKANPMTKKESCGADAVANINRADFGVNFGANFGFKMDVKLLISIEAGRT